MDVQGMMPTRMHPTKKKPCCPKAKKSQPWMDGTLNTEYRNEFIDKEVPVQRAGPKQGPPMANGPFDGSTTYGGDFKPYQVARSGPIIPPNSQTLNGGEFNGDSTYKQNFGPKAVPYERIRARTAFEPNRGEFYGQTTYGGDFKTMGVPQPAKMIQRVNNVEKSGPFEGESLYKSTFTKMANAQRAPANPRGGGQVLPPGAFEGDTIYRSNYVPKEIGVPEQFRPKDARQAPEGWFEGMPSTEYRGQFIDKEVPTVQPVRPNRGGDVLPKGPLDGSTTYGGAFKHCQGPPATLSRPVDAQEREKLPFNGTSSYQSAFIPKAVPYSRVRAARNFEPNKAPFDGSTTHKAAYQGYAVVPTHRAGPQHAAREHVPFEGQSAYKADFVKMNGAQRAPKVPQNARVRSGPFEGTTTYRKDFTEKEIPAGEDSCTDCDSDDMEDYPLIG